MNMRKGKIDDRHRRLASSFDDLFTEKHSVTAFNYNQLTSMRSTQMIRPCNGPVCTSEILWKSFFFSLLLGNTETKSTIPREEVEKNDDTQPHNVRCVYPIQKKTTEANYEK